MLPHHVNFPAHDVAQQQFYDYVKLPRVVGCIDGTHVKIKKPSNDAHAYINRKGVASINIMLVCGLNLQIYYSLVKYPGGAHDSYILNNSQLCANWTENPPNGWLLGDAGYPLKRWLMTPVTQITSQKDATYQARRTKCRATIERCNGLLKSRFRCLLNVLEYAPEKCCRIIRACIVLHNFAIRYSVPFNEEIIMEEDAHVNQLPELNADANALAIRRHLIDNLV